MVSTDAPRPEHPPGAGRRKRGLIVVLAGLLVTVSICIGGASSARAADLCLRTTSLKDDTTSIYIIKVRNICEQPVFFLFCISRENGSKRCDKHFAISRPIMDQGDADRIELYGGPSSDYRTVEVVSCKDDTECAALETSFMQNGTMTPRSNVVCQWFGLSGGCK